MKEVTGKVDVVMEPVLLRQLLRHSLLIIKDPQCECYYRPEVKHLADSLEIQKMLASYCMAVHPHAEVLLMPMTLEGFELKVEQFAATVEKLKGGVH